MKVSDQSKDMDGKITGSHDINPFLSALTCDVEFHDCEIKGSVDNVTNENTHA